MSVGEQSSVISLHESGSDEPEHGARRDLASLYRAAALYHWGDLIFTHISARIPGDREQFLINEYGLRFDEVTASNLVKVDASGSVLDVVPGEINPAGFAIHSAIHRECPNAMYVMHLHTRDGIAVAAQKGGLLPISQQALLVYDEIAYHDYGGIVEDEAEQQRLLRDMGNSRIVVLRNHGSLFVGESPQEVFLNAYFYQSACSIQVSAGSRELSLVPTQVLEKVKEQKGRMRDSSARGAAAAKVWKVVLRTLTSQDDSFLN